MAKIGGGVIVSVYVMVSEGSRRWARQLNDSILRWKARHELEMVPSATYLVEANPKDFRRWIENDFITYDQLVELKSEVAFVCSDIKATFAREKSKRYITSDEFKQFHDLRDIYTGKYAAIEAVIVKKKQQHKRIAARRLPLSHYFMDIAREQLPDSQFRDMKEQAITKMRNDV